MVRAGLAGMHVQPRPRKKIKGRFEFQVSSFMVLGSLLEARNWKLETPNGPVAQLARAHP
jgi:hypothetical protein